MMKAILINGLDAINKGDYATALNEWKPLAKQGNADVQFLLGLMYVEGKGVPQNYETALKWYTLAANQGNADAQHNLGVMYYDGEGVPQDYKTAIKWYILPDLIVKKACKADSGAVLMPWKN